jgi:hypothetical protein
MPPDNQVPEGDSPRIEPPAPAPIEASDAAPTLAAPETAVPAPAPLEAAPRHGPETGLLIWLGILVVCGIGGLLFGGQELAALVALAGMFIAAQAADLDPRWGVLYLSLAWVVPIGGGATFAATTVLIAQSDLAGPLRIGILALSVASGLVCLATLFRPISDPLTRLLMRTATPSHTLRLGARLVIAGILLAVPGWYAFRNIIQTLFQNSEQLMDQLPQVGGLVGYVLLALAAVGFLVRRDLRATLTRLGIARIGLRELAVIALGVGVLFVLDWGADSLQHHFFPALWKSDQQFNEALAGGLKPVQVVMLGLTAGIGEEITLRGALQPRLGIRLTSLLFAALHVQYSWYGMLVIFVLGMVLGTIRQRTNTSVAMTVHAIYDVIAVMTS